MMEFRIVREEEKISLLDWHENYKKLQCREHRKSAHLNLFINQSGSHVSINACCEDFFRRIVTAKRKLRRLNEDGSPELN